MTIRTALVIGATQGLGLALTEHYLREGWTVIATTVAPSTGLDTLLAQFVERLDVRILDVVDVAGVATLQVALSGRTIDVLHIVAGVFQASFDPIWEQPGDEILRVLDTNAIAGVRLAETFSAQVPTGGVIAFTSSGMSSMTRNDKGDVDLYRISKAALNMLVRSFAARHIDSGRSVLLICPGWAKTEMGGGDADVEVSDSVAGMYALITAADPTRNGAQFFEYNGDAVPW